MYPARTGIGHAAVGAVGQGTASNVLRRANSTHAASQERLVRQTTQYSLRAKASIAKDGGLPQSPIQPRLPSFSPSHARKDAVEIKIGKLALNSS